MRRNRKNRKSASASGARPIRVAEASPPASAESAGRYLRIRVKDDTMRPTLYAGDIAVLDTSKRPEQGQIVAVEVTEVQAFGDFRQAPKASPLYAFRRKFEFAGEVFYSSERPGVTGKMMRFGGAIAVVSIEEDELSRFASVPRPSEAECRAQAARELVKLMGRSMSHPASKRAIAEAAKCLADLEQAGDRANASRVG
ncbi:MAG TPA: S24 family peptidase [Phycisphaerae bacterium]|nr:S24 family peptidase [Phycisphaerae bacterium]